MMDVRLPLPKKMEIARDPLRKANAGQVQVNRTHCLQDPSEGAVGMAKVEWFRHRFSGVGMRKAADK